MTFASRATGTHAAKTSGAFPLLSLKRGNIHDGGMSAITALKIMKIAARCPRNNHAPCCMLLRHDVFLSVASCWFTMICPVAVSRVQARTIPELTSLPELTP